MAYTQIRGHEHRPADVHQWADFLLLLDRRWRAVTGQPLPVEGERMAFWWRHRLPCPPEQLSGTVVGHRLHSEAGRVTCLVLVSVGERQVYYVAPENLSRETC